MTIPDKYNQAPGESLSAFHARVDAMRRHSRQAAHLLRKAKDHDLYGEVGVYRAAQFADAASAFPEETLAELPEVDEPSREKMFDALVVPFVDHVASTAAAHTNEETSRRLGGSYERGMAYLGSLSGTPVDELMVSQFSNDKTAYNRAVFSLYR